MNVNLDSFNDKMEEIAEEGDKQINTVPLNIDIKYPKTKYCDISMSVFTTLGQQQMPHVQPGPRVNQWVVCGFVCVCDLLVFTSRWLKFEEDVEDGGERWSKPYVATLSLHSLFELRSCILNGTVMLDMRANSIEEIAGDFVVKITFHFTFHTLFLVFCGFTLLWLPQTW